MGDRDEKWRQKKQAVEAESRQRRQKMSGGGRKRSGGGRKWVVEAEDGQWR